jgi:hypothetical protein
MSDLELDTDNYAESRTSLNAFPSQWNPANNYDPLLVVYRLDPRGDAMHVHVDGEYNHALVCDSSSGIGATIMGRSYGVLAHSDTDVGVFGETYGAGMAAVWGYNGVRGAESYGVVGDVATGLGAGVMGWGGGSSGTGVKGHSIIGDGVEGFTAGKGAGVYGQNDAKFSSNYASNGPGVFGEGLNGSDGVKGTSIGKTDSSGVVGFADRGYGVSGLSSEGTGVSGFSLTGHGVFGGSSAGIGVFALTRHGQSPALYATSRDVAGFFEGDVVVSGNLLVPTGQLVVGTPGNKNGVVASADGSERLVYAIESPEAWFEDFGEASLVEGKAHVALDRHFARTIEARRYHVFLTPYGETAGLYVARRTKNGFDVAERKPGKSNASFSWRVVAKPKGAKNGRFARTTAPETVDRVQSAIARDKRMRSVMALNDEDVKIRVRRASKMLKRIKPKPSGRPKVPKLPKRSELEADLRSRPPSPPAPRRPLKKPGEVIVRRR